MIGDQNAFHFASAEDEEMEEIEGDIIPQWLISDDKEEDNDTNLYKDISIKIEGGTNVLVYQKHH